MINVLILGCGQIGRAIANILKYSAKYHPVLADSQMIFPSDWPENQTCQLDIQNADQAVRICQKKNIHAIINCLPFQCNLDAAHLALQLQCHYFDLSEDLEQFDELSRIAQQSHQPFFPQCGLAPGWVNIIANHLAQSLDTVDSIRIRCGALPQQPTSPWEYALTWSIDGLINEYLNPAIVINDSHMQSQARLSQLETLIVNGNTFEAFTTSGGCGNLPNQWNHEVQTLNYKTIRHPGHLKQFLAFLSHHNENDREAIKAALLQSLPTTTQDQVVLAITASGLLNGEPTTHTFNKIYKPTTIEDQSLTAIQFCTALGALSVIDHVLSNNNITPGLHHPEELSLTALQGSHYTQPLLAD